MVLNDQSRNGTHLWREWVLFNVFSAVIDILLYLHCVSVNEQNYFCYNYVKLPPNLIIFGTKWQTVQNYMRCTFSTSRNSTSVHYRVKRRCSKLFQNVRICALVQFLFLNSLRKQHCNLSALVNFWSKSCPPLKKPFWWKCRRKFISCCTLSV